MGDQFSLMASTDNGSDLGIETNLVKAADKLRGKMEPSDYKHVALGLIFLKHISDGFELKHQSLLAEYPEGAEDPDEYRAYTIFWVSARPGGCRSSWCPCAGGGDLGGIRKTTYVPNNPRLSLFFSVNASITFATQLRAVTD